MSAAPEPHTPRHRNHAMGNRVVCATPRRGKEISNYSLGDRLGKGAFAIVYKAIHLRTAQVAAIKQIPLEKIKSVDSVMEEIELLQDLEHPNIVKYFGFMKDDAHLNIVLEYCENGSLAMILHKFGRFPENLVAQYMRQILEGLSYLHQQGIIHRDIKGANILTTKEGVAKLADFGVAMRIVGGEQAERPKAVGTPHWMAPEIIQMQEPSTACDIWSLGATVVELKSGQPPYGDRQDISAMYAIVQQDSAGIIPADCSGSLRDFLTLCFEKNPDLRVSASTLLNHLWVRKFGGKEAHSGQAKAVAHAEQAVKEWNSPSRRKRLAVPSVLNLRASFPESTAASKSRPTAFVANDDTYENEFESLSFFDRNQSPLNGDEANSAVSANVVHGEKRQPSTPRLNLPAKRKHLSDFVETSSSLDEYNDDFDEGSLKPPQQRAVSAASASGRSPLDQNNHASICESSKGDPFQGLEDLLEQGPDEKVLCAQQETEELARLISTDSCNIAIAYKRLAELVTSLPVIRKTIDHLRILPKALSKHTKKPEPTDSKTVAALIDADREKIVAFLQLLDVCVRADRNTDFLTNFCIAGGLSFVLAQSHIDSSLVLRLIYNMSNISLMDNECISIAAQLAFREDAIVVVCSFFNEKSSGVDLFSASTIILDMFKVCGPRRRANLWHHFNAYGLFASLVDLLHLPCVLENDAQNKLAENFYRLVTSFSRNPQELLIETTNHRVLRRLMRAYIRLPAGSPHRLVLLEFFKNVSTLAPVLDAMQRGNIAPHLIAALRRAMHDDRVPPAEAHQTANCLVPTLFNYSRLNRSRQREVARYGLLTILQDCVYRYPRLREFAFPIFIALVHAGHEECWKALWQADALPSFIELIAETGWQAMSIAAIAAWIQAQPKQVGPKFVPHIAIISDTLLNTTGSTFESVLSAVASLLYQNRYLCGVIPIHDLFIALNRHITASNSSTNSASLVQSLQIVVWVLGYTKQGASTELVSSGLLESIKNLGNDDNTPVPCIKLIGQITEMAQPKF